MGELDRSGSGAGWHGSSAPSNAASDARRLDPRALYRLIYFSRSLVAPLDLGGLEVIQDILLASRSRNADRGITGALAFNNDHFAQVLEGSRAAVVEVFRSIQKYALHMRVVVLEEGWIEARDFGDWAMAYAGDPGEPNVIAFNRDLGSALAKGGRGQGLLDMMKYCVSP